MRVARHALSAHTKMNRANQNANFAHHAKVVVRERIVAAQRKASATYAVRVSTRSVLHAACDKGRYQEDDNQKSCKACPPGKFQTQPKGTFCISCGGLFGGIDPSAASYCKNACPANSNRQRTARSVLTALMANTRTWRRRLRASPCGRASKALSSQ